MLNLCVASAKAAMLALRADLQDRPQWLLVCLSFHFLYALNFSFFMFIIFLCLLFLFVRICTSYFQQNFPADFKGPYSKLPTVFEKPIEWHTTYDSTTHMGKAGPACP
jgi:hypothetical protein